MLLENPAGPYTVGATTFALSVKPTRVFGTAGVRTETGEIAPALRLVEVSFTAYYPVSRATAKSRWKKWLDWLPRYVLHHDCAEFELTKQGSTPHLAGPWPTLSEGIPALQVS
jgi:hypothetical protein